jgi:hypothetical protein
MAPAQVLTSCIRRWHVKATCEEAQAHLGSETQRQWSDSATAWTAPVLLALYSLVTLIAAHRLGTHTIPARTAAWDRHEAATCSDAMAVVRRWFWAQAHCSLSQSEDDVVNIPRS